MKEAKFWSKEFIKSEKCQQYAEEVFSQNVRDNWGNYSEDTRKDIIEKFVNRIGQVFYGERNWWDKLWGKHPSNINIVEYNLIDDGSYGVSYGNGTIGINYRFVSAPTKNYSLDKLIDTLVHEVRHQYQQDVWNNPNKFAVPESLRNEWDNRKYKSVSKYSYYDYYHQEVERDARAFAAVSRPSN